jgi:ankyrin repeat protein
MKTFFLSVACLIGTFCSLEAMQEHKKSKLDDTTKEKSVTIPPLIELVTKAIAHYKLQEQQPLDTLLIEIMELCQHIPSNLVPSFLTYIVQANKVLSLYHHPSVLILCSECLLTAGDNQNGALAHEFLTTMLQDPSFQDRGQLHPAALAATLQCPLAMKAIVVLLGQEEEKNENLVQAIKQLLYHKHEKEALSLISIVDRLVLANGTSHQEDDLSLAEYAYRNRCFAAAQKIEELVSQSDSTFDIPYQYEQSFLLGDAEKVAEFLTYRKKNSLESLQVTLRPAAQDPLLYALRKNYGAVVKLLLEAGAPLYRIDKAGCTTLHCACLSNNAELVRYLLSYPKVKDQINDMTPQTVEDAFLRGTAPLHIACYKGNVALAELLLDNGADIEIEENDDEDEPHNSPLHIACYTNNVELATLLLKRGAYIHKRNNYDRKPLLEALACERGANTLSLLTLLLDNGALLSDRENYGKSYLDLALETLNPASISFIIERAPTMVKDKHIAFFIESASRGDHFLSDLTEKAKQIVAELIEKTYPKSLEFFKKACNSKDRPQQ